MTWEYVAGFLDADGSITASRRNRNKRLAPEINFTNTELTILEAIRDFILAETGHAGFISKKPARKATHSDSYQLAYGYLPKVLAIIERVHLVHPKKVERARLIKEVIAPLTPRNGKYTGAMIEERTAAWDNFFNI